MATNTNLPIAGRIVAAKLALKRAPLELEELQIQRNAALVAGDAGEGERADLAIQAHHRATQRYRDAIALLEPLASEERTATRFPPAVADARRRLSELKQQYGQMASKVGIAHEPTSAAFDHEFLLLRDEVRLLEQHIEMTSRMQGAAA